MSPGSGLIYDSNGNVVDETALLQQIAASLDTIDAAVPESGRMPVNLIVGQAGITAGAGAVSALTPRVTHASDDPAVTSLALIDDIIGAHDAAIGSTKVGVIGGRAADPTSLPTAVAAGDISYMGLSLQQEVFVYKTRLDAGEDLTNDVQKIEQRFTVTRVTADAQIKAGGGFVHSITISPTTATPTAGLLTVYDNTAESGTIIFSEWVFATTPAHTVFIDATFGTGLYVGYDGTLANVSVSVSWR